MVHWYSLGKSGLFLSRAVLTWSTDERAVEIASSRTGRANILPKNPRDFAVFAEGPLEEITKLQADISECAGRLVQVGAA